MNLDSKRSTRARVRAVCRAQNAPHTARAHAADPFKKKRKLFLISQVLLSKYKNSMLPYCNIYGPRAAPAGGRRARLLSR